MKRLTTEDLRQVQSKTPDVSVINVLDEEHFQEAHIPRTKNIPHERDDFVDRVEKEVGDKNNPVVVYCASTECDASPRAAKKLEEAGFRRVYDYEGGTKAWKEAGLEIETGFARARR